MAQIARNQCDMWDGIFSASDQPHALRNDKLEHHHDIERSASGIAFAFMIVYDLKFSAKIFLRDKSFQIRQYITVLRQILQTIVYSKKSVQHVRLQYCS